MLRTLCVSLAALAAVAGPRAPACAASNEPYVILMSNNFIGNDWRQQMERVAAGALGPEKRGVAALLAAPPEVDGILTLAYGTGARQALKGGDRPMVPIIAAAFDGTGVACARTEGAKCGLGANPPSLSADLARLGDDHAAGGLRELNGRPCRQAH